MHGFLVLLLAISALAVVNAFSFSSTKTVARQMSMKVENDAFRKQNREMRKASATDRLVEIRAPLGLVLDEDEDGNVFVVEVEKGGRAERTGKVFQGDYIAMAQATFGDDMWSCRGVGLDRVLSVVKMRNNKPVKLVLEAANEAEEKKRRAIAFAEASEEEKAAKKLKDDALLADMLEEDKSLLKKRKFFGLF
jgi:C-terminal processing protease CtpA/Prc